MKKIILLFTILLSITMSANSIDKIVDKSDKGVATVYSDGKQAITTVYNDAKSIAPEIASNIKGIAQELKVGADHVWQILVKQQLVWSIGFLCMTILSMCNWILFYRRNLKKPTNDQYEQLERDIIGELPNPRYESYYDKGLNTTDPKGFKTVKGAVGREQYMCLKPKSDTVSGFKYYHLLFCIILTGLSIYNFPSMLTGFINPEFGAMKDIILFTTKIK